MGPTFHWNTSVFWLTFASIFFVAPAALADDSSTVTTDTTSPKTTASTKDTKATKDTKDTKDTTAAQAKSPSITAVFPAAPVIAPNQPFTLLGSGFEEKLAVTFTDPEGHAWPVASGDVLLVSQQHDRVIVLAPLGMAGTWKAKVTNTGGAASEPWPFPVGNTLPVDRTPAMWAFWATLGVVTVLLIVLFSFMLHDLHTSQKLGQWSFGDALSEESEFQPKEIRQKSDVILLGSSSRLIALLGLLGILTVVIGVGYSVMWNLFLYGTVPDLSQVRTFLYGSACLFAPYLANKLAGMVPGSSPPQSSSASAQSTAITAVAPSDLTAAAGAQALHLTGTGFQPGLTLTLTDPTNSSTKVATAAILLVEPTLVSANVTLQMAGSWKVTVTNPGSTVAATFPFTVKGKPTIEGPATVTKDPAPQKVTFVGKGFMSGLTVSLTPPGAAATTLNATTVTATSVVVTATLPNAGDGQVVITNPENKASDAFAFKVS